VSNAPVVSLLAQSGAVISGTIKDPSGALISNASVDVTNINTNVTRHAVTNSTGYYEVRELNPGEYSVVASATGFKKASRSAIPIQVAQVAQIDLSLEVGDTTQVLEVQGVAPLLDTKTAELGQVVNQKQVVELPLNDRNYLRLVLLAPGTSSYYNRSFFNSALTDNIGSVNSGAMGEDRNAFILDGADTKAYLINMSFVPSIDAIQEFKVETTPYDVALGTSPGAQVIVTTKSGTNQLHGTVWEYLRNDATDARTFFSPSVPELRKNQFGYTIGGRIVKDRLFFFANNEFYLGRIGETFAGTVPTSAMKTGDFSGAGAPVFDPLSTAACSSCSTGVSRQPFPNNVIPASRLDPVATGLLSLWPAPTQAAIVSNGAFVGQNYSSSGVDKVTRNHGNYRMDWNAPNNKDALFGRVSYNNSTEDLAKGVFSSGTLPGFGDHFTLDQRNIQLHETHTFSPTTIIEGMVSFYRAFPNISPNQLGNSVNQKLGIQGVRQNEPPDVSITGFSGPTSNPYAPEYDLTNQFQYVVRLTKIINKHTLNFGAEYDRWQFFENHAPRYPMGLFSFNGSFTKDPNTPATTGYSFADFLLGYPVSGQTENGDDSAYWFRNNFRWFVGDEWRVNSDLTLNLGVRWEYDGPGYEKRNHLVNFDFRTNSLVFAGTDTPATLLSGTSLVYGLPVEGTSNRSTLNRDLHNYQPRIGFAYRIPGHSATVLRGGYGIFTDILQMNILNDTRANFPFVNFPNLVVANATQVLPVTNIATAFGPSAAGATKPNFKAIDQNLVNGYLQQASFAIERQFGGDFLFSIGYNWQKYTHFLDQPGVNQPAVNGTFVRPFPQFNSITLLTNGEYGHYNALLVKLEKRFSKGLTSLTSFTWSKNLDDTSAGSASIGAPGDPGPQTPYCYACDFGRSSSDFELRFVQSLVYQIPIPGSLAANKFATNTIGGWQFSTIITAQSGFPITPLVSFDNSESLNNADRPNIVPGVPIFGPGTQTPNRWFNAAAFTVAPPKQFGNAGRHIIDGPGIFTWDATMMKNFAIMERYNLQFRAEFFNLTNRANFADPNANINTPQAGLITSTTTNARQLQFALRLAF
jgi:hypothetical protein